MSNWRWVLRSLVYHGRMNLAVALGVAAAAAVLIGALIVGDSVRGSLRSLALDRLGRIDEVLVSERFFRTALAEELAGDPRWQSAAGRVVPLLLFPRATVQRSGGGARATGVLLIGGEGDFWELGDADARPAELPGPQEIVLNEPLARELGARPGDQLLLRLPTGNEVPPDSPLGHTTDRIRTVVGLRVVAVVPARSLGRFSLSPSQTEPRNAFVHPRTLQRVLDQQDRVNTLLVSYGEPSTAATRQALRAALQPRLADFGIRIRRIRATYQPDGEPPERVSFDYFQISTRRMVFEPEAAAAVRQAFAEEPVQAVSTYIANTIARAAGSDPADEIPYSVISGVDSQPLLGPLRDEQGQPLLLGPDEIVLNRWAAEELGVAAGDRIRLDYFQPEAAYGQLEAARAELGLRAIAPLTEPARGFTRRQAAVFEQRPALSNDPDLTPEVEGLTDQASIDDWEAPFPVDRDRVRPQDDDYWSFYRTTPKAFVSLATAERLWGSRFGLVTSFRLPVTGELPPGSEAEREYMERLEGRLTTALAEVQDELGFAFDPIRQRSLAAASGTTPFDLLFLALSFFVIAAAILLVTLLFRLAVERRAAEVGTLLATGFQRRQVTRLLIVEGLIVAAAGAAVGIVVGTGYAWLMIRGLRTWWVGAITTPFLQLYLQPLTLVWGYGAATVIAAVTIAFSLRFMKRVPVRRLLAGRATVSRPVGGPAGRVGWGLALLLLIAAVVLAGRAAASGGEAQAASFVGAGAAVLAALLIAVRSGLRGDRLTSASATFSLPLLAARNAGRNPARSTLTVGLMAVASFLIISMGAFRAEPTVQGTGGFDLLAETDRPIFENLQDPETQQLLLGDRAEVLEDGRVISLRVQAGDDASCTNLYRPSQPRVLGVPSAMSDHYDQPDQTSFGWVSTAASTPAEVKNPWRMLAGEAGEARLGRAADAVAIPVILDQNTARYSLHLYGGIGEEFVLEYAGERPLRFRVVGLLDTCILQGNLLIGERDFVRAFPRVAGYQLFLVQTGSQPRSAVSDALEDRLTDYGFAALRTEDRLRDLLAVQNTYLSTFQALGALGLLLGTFGLATVQVRNVVERRSELALLRAAGFSRRRLGAMVMGENLALLLGGLLSGFLAALVVVLPSIYAGGAAIPLGDLSIMLAVVLVAGILSSLASVRATLRAPLLPALRGD